MTDSKKKEILQVLGFLLWDNSPEAHTTREGFLTKKEAAIIKEIIEEAKKSYVDR